MGGWIEGWGQLGHQEKTLPLGTEEPWAGAEPLWSKEGAPLKAQMGATD
jgi:hypothetical protein